MTILGLSLTTNDQTPTRKSAKRNHLKAHQTRIRPFTVSQSKLFPQLLQRRADIQGESFTFLGAGTETTSCRRRVLHHHELRLDPEFSRNQFAKENKGFAHEFPLAFSRLSRFFLSHPPHFNEEHALFID